MSAKEKRYEFAKFQYRFTLLESSFAFLIFNLRTSLKLFAQNNFNEVRNKLAGSGKVKSDIDVTLPGLTIARGHLHPMTLVQQELEDLFSSMGFMVLDGPELESDYYCFESHRLHLQVPRSP